MMRSGKPAPSAPLAAPPTDTTPTGTTPTGAAPTGDLYAAADFESFFAIYDRMHADPRTRKLHALATASAATLLAWGLLRRKATPILLAPLVDHAIAQASHRLIEHNRTTPLRRPLWHLRAELRLFRQTMTGA
jgi:hypothetical protein